MGRLTVSCPTAALGPGILNKRNSHEIIYKEVRKVVNEDDLIGIQLYPAGWPRKLQITVKNEELKDLINLLTNQNAKI